MHCAPISQRQAFLAVARRRSFSGAARELAVSRSALSQSVRQLEEHLRVTLLTRTTRSVSLTDAGRRLVERAGPALGEVIASLTEVAAQPGEVLGRLRLSVPRAAVPFVIEPMRPTFRARHPRVEVEVTVEDRFVDIVAAGYDAGVRMSEAIECDMVQVRLSDALRFVIVGSPEYLARRGAAPAPRRAPAPRVHHLPLAEHRRAVRVGAGARTQDLARSRARPRGDQRHAADALVGRAGPRARVRLRA